MAVGIEDVEFESERFAYARVTGHPLWPCVVYNKWGDIPPEIKGQAEELFPKPSQIVAYFIEPWSFCLVQKKDVRSVQDVVEEDIIKKCKRPKQRHDLRLAIDCMKSMQFQPEDAFSVPGVSDPPNARSEKNLGQEAGEGPAMPACPGKATSVAVRKANSTAKRARGHSSADERSMGVEDRMEDRGTARTTSSQSRPAACTPKAKQRTRAPLAQSPTASSRSGPPVAPIASVITPSTIHDAPRTQLRGKERAKSSAGSKRKLPPSGPRPIFTAVKADAIGSPGPMHAVERIGQKPGRKKACTGPAKVSPLSVPMHPAGGASSPARTVERMEKGFGKLVRTIYPRLSFLCRQEARHRASMSSSVSKKGADTIGNRTRGPGYGKCVPAASTPLKDLSLEKLMDDGVIEEGMRIILPPHSAGHSGAEENRDSSGNELARSTHDAAEEQTALMIGDGQLLFNEKVYDSVEDVLEVWVGLKLNKREKKGWAQVRVREGAVTRSLAVHVEQKLRDHHEEEARLRAGAQEAISVLAAPSQNKAPEGSHDINQKEEDTAAALVASLAMESPTGRTFSDRIAPDLHSGKASFKIVGQPGVSNVKKGRSIVKQEGNGKAFFVRIQDEAEKEMLPCHPVSLFVQEKNITPMPKVEDNLEAASSIPRSLGKAPKKPSSTMQQHVTVPNSIRPPCDDNFQENPFVGFWKTADPAVVERAMETYAVWVSEAYPVLQRNDSSFVGVGEDKEAGISAASAENVHGNGCTGGGDEGTERQLRKQSARKSMRVSDRLHEIQAGKLPPHTLLICEEYGLTPEGVGRRTSSHHANIAQPFTVKVHPDVPFLCDVHAHLADSEIIGFLAGKFNAEERCLYIQAPFPCRATARSDDGSTDVEMDPGSEIEVREVIGRHGMAVTGWYHSHPTFQPEPSLIDIENQYNYQMLLRDKTTAVEPFVGLIVGTYDDSYQNPVSLLRYFHVRHIRMGSASNDGVSFPMALDVLHTRKRKGECSKSPDSALSGSVHDERIDTKGDGADPVTIGLTQGALAAATLVRTKSPQKQQQEETDAALGMMSLLACALPTLPVPSSRGPGTHDPLNEEGGSRTQQSDMICGKSQQRNREVGKEGNLAPNVYVSSALVTSAGTIPEQQAQKWDGFGCTADGNVCSARTPCVRPSTSVMKDAPPKPCQKPSTSIFLAVKEKRHRKLPPSSQIWSSFERLFLGSSEPELRNSGQGSQVGLRATLETVRALVQYYSRLDTRVKFDEEWRKGVCKGEKFEFSLRKRVNQLSLGDAFRQEEFLTLLVEYICACWAEGTPKKLPQPEDFSGTRSERRAAAAAATSALLQET
ncbi:JAB1/Mov34/MPN/PAD-1 [Nannochloropsis gaditana]|uniref:JAB1/Mov34/MPN/PAD-1 n=1 Tax=Nannochloropsis gaditana TaxID=72520 RepID=W7TNR9_9STRA|nr:JAB1/Mov34/MPN/PAD-1 [Nannochloropsis gaditana]